MTAPRAATARVARPAPARPEAERAARPHLRVVPPPRPRRAGVVVAAALVVVFASLLGTAVLHTMLVSGQRDLDQLDQRIADTQHANQALELQVAELESPARIVAAAKALGMVQPAEVIWVSPRAGGGTETDTAVETDVQAETDERAGEDPDAPEDGGTAG